ncbi:hypothetical protein [Nisaea sediminum]|uniref:hypothetical protein n=1 Tax=Nisaea sediminum TaxID=2775867 RepID=UPI0018660C77|nr:hypothetical protein [Nisaea sediminum]
MLRKLVGIPVACLVLLAAVVACESIPAPMDKAADVVVDAKSNEARVVRFAGFAEIGCATLTARGDTDAGPACARLRGHAEAVAAALQGNFFERTISAGGQALALEAYRLIRGEVPSGKLSADEYLQLAADALRTFEPARAAMTDLAGMVKAVDAGAMPYGDALGEVMAQFDKSTKL